MNYLIPIVVVVIVLLALSVRIIQQWDVGSGPVVVYTGKNMNTHLTKISCLIVRD